METTPYGDALGTQSSSVSPGLLQAWGPLPILPQQTKLVTKGVDLKVGKVQILVEIEQARDEAGQDSRRERERGPVNPSGRTPFPPLPCSNLTASDSPAHFSTPDHSASAVLCQPCSLGCHSSNTEAERTCQAQNWRSARQTGARR